MLYCLLPIGRPRYVSAATSTVNCHFASVSDAQTPRCDSGGTLRYRIAVIDVNREVLRERGAEHDAETLNDERTKPAPDGWAHAGLPYVEQPVLKST